MTTKPSHLLVERLGDITVIGFAERHLREDLQLRRINEELNYLVESEPRPKLMIHFDDVEHLASSALAMFEALSRRARERGGEVRLANINPDLYRAFVVTGLNKSLHIHPSLDAAMGSFT